eukprot:TRINITY_DN35501_c1_g1_i3.p6 TRINITY_DN35501_c1_g1~~TRINITY_DN35501_c1_g1_i3.p6  ORF type:complete len:123 (-),score=12.70 TRINITY_DN35501_c1_g1_i3:313-681(-)
MQQDSNQNMLHIIWINTVFLIAFAGTLRGDIRRKYSLPEEPCSDCCVHFCCSALAICQEAQELRKQGATNLQGNQNYQYMGQPPPTQPPMYPQSPVYAQMQQPPMYAQMQQPPNMYPAVVNY